MCTSFEGEGHLKKCIFCNFVKMLTFVDAPRVICIYELFLKRPGFKMLSQNNVPLGSPYNTYQTRTCALLVSCSLLI